MGNYEPNGACISAGPMLLTNKHHLHYSARRKNASFCLIKTYCVAFYCLFAHCLYIYIYIYI